jgi:hypothetical protein
MHADVHFEEYLAEVRKQVCGRCPERPPARAPFAPACWRCGIESQLPELIEAIHDADAELPEFGPAPAPRAVCARCSRLGGDTCPCPVASLATRVMQAVRTVDERHEQWDVVRRRLAGQQRTERPPIQRMIRAYEAATGTCVCCD